jgi:hypothetical protein
MTRGEAKVKEGELVRREDEILRFAQDDKTGDSG